MSTSRSTCTITLPVVGLHRLADGERVAGHVHVVEGDVALAVRRRALDQRDRELRQLVVQELLPVHLHVLHPLVVRGEAVDAGPLLARIHKDVQPHLGERAGKAARLGADRVGDAAQRQVVGLKAVLQHDLLGAGHGAEMAADQPVHRALADIALRVAVLIPDAEAGAGDDGQVVRGLHTLIAPVDGLVQLHGVFDADEGIYADATRSKRRKIR